MFEISFVEIVLIAVVSLVVLGPEKLPEAVRTAALWIGRLKRSFNSIKTEIEKEVGADEIRRQLRNEEIMAKFKHTQAQVQNTISSVKKDVDTFQKNVELEAKVAAGVSNPASGTASTTASETISTIAATPAPNSGQAEAGTSTLAAPEKAATQE